jgi:arylsulfatase A-like enzyme
VWDTVRADHLSLYGYGRATTPRLDAWAKDARVFEDVRSVAGYTLPSHASMFTGLMPSEHCTHNDHKRLDDDYTTIAELLSGAGYQTFLFSANPHISSENRNFGQGFDVATGAFSPEWSQEAERLVREKLAREDRSSGLPSRYEAANRGRTLLNAWDLKASGPIVERAALNWLESTSPDRPWFVFLNYMEAHPPYIPSREHRRRFLSEDDVNRSYRVDRSWTAVWEYTFGLREMSQEDIALTRATYDATLAELDDLFADLLESLEEGGFLENTVVVLTSDHGEHLGEQHMLDHQYSLYEPVLRIPLVIYAPGRIEPGRDRRPVMNLDLFATVLDLAGIEAPPGTRGSSLVDLSEERVRLAEEPALTRVGLSVVERRGSEFDPSTYQRRLRALTAPPYKYIWASDGRNALYDLDADPSESENRIDDDPVTAARLEAMLATRVDELAPCAGAGEDVRADSPDERRLLEELGYIEDDDDAPPES